MALTLRHCRTKSKACQTNANDTQKSHFYSRATMVHQMLVTLMLAVGFILGTHHVTAVPSTNLREGRSSRWLQQRELQYQCLLTRARIEDKELEPWFCQLDPRDADGIKGMA